MRAVMIRRAAPFKALDTKMFHNCFTNFLTAGCRLCAVRRGVHKDAIHLRHARWPMMVAGAAAAVAAAAAEAVATTVAATVAAAALASLASAAPDAGSVLAAAASPAATIFGHERSCAVFQTPPLQQYLQL